MEPASSAESAPLSVDTRAPTAPAPIETTPLSPPSSDARIAGSAASEVVRKGSNEWTSPRSRGRHGTPPPVPRRASRGGDDDIANIELPPRPRTPAQVLASRAAAAKATSSPRGSMTEDATASAPVTVGALDDETLEEKRERPEAAGFKDEENGSGHPDALDDMPRRTSVQLSGVGSESYYASENEDSESYRDRRDDRVDTSTVDEESMYNDDEDDEFDGDETHESAGTSDSYVNIHEEDNDDDGAYGQRLNRGEEESFTPDSTPPPSPPRPVQQQQHQQRPPPPLALEWVKYVADSGHEYYFNTHTNVSQWTRPAELLSPRNEAEQANDNEPEENQSEMQDSQATMLPQLHVQVMEVEAPPQQQQQHVAGQNAQAGFHPSMFLEHLFAAAAKNDETAQLQAILRYDIDVNAVSAAGLTPLHIAVQHGNARGAAMLLDHGALVDGPSQEAGSLNSGGQYASSRLIETPLVMACRTNHASLVRLLVRYGASVYTRDVDDNTVLHIAIRCWSDEVLNCLLEMDSIAAIINLRNADDETPLHLAARHGNAHAVKALLSSGASSDVEDAQGRTPLVVSIMENRVDCALLLQAGVYSKAYVVPSAADGSNEPAMYDATTNEDDSAKQRSDELEGLRIYLGQLVQHATTDGVLVSTVYQYMDAVRREIAALVSANAESRQREENLISQIDELTNRESTTISELAKEREENERLHQQLEAKETELSSLQAAYESLSSRSTMLESIARSSQEKLRRERVEYSRQEEYWNQTIENSLRENAALLESVQSLQQGWQAQSTDAAQTAFDGEDTTGSHEVYEDTHDTIEQQGGYGDYTTQAHYESYEGYYSSAAYDQSYDVKQQSYGDSQHGYTDQAFVEPKAASSTPSAKSEPERPISPERVDAVWNRFFENMSRAADVRDPQAQRNPVYSPRQAAAPVSMLPPSSAVFDAVRKNSKERLHQLLLSGISPNIRDLGEKGTPLHLASELGDLESVMLLCEFGADVEIRDENGNTPLLVACSQGHYECTKFLLQSAANQAAFNASRDTALHLAAWDGSFECVEILLEYGVDVLARNALGLTALGNLRTRSPLRHRFDDLSDDHPMAKTLELLSEAEQLEKDDVIEQAQDAPHKAPVISPPASSHVPKTTSNAVPQAGSTSWGRWILGSVFGSMKAATPQTDNDEDDEDSRSEFEEAQSSPSKLQTTGTRNYEDLRPPPEIEAELRRRPLSPASDSLPPPPPEVLDALERRKFTSGGGVLLSPTTSTTRFATPASMGTKKSASGTPTGVRSRYVDTFNSP